MSWKISFFCRKVEQEVLDLPDGILANMLRILELIVEFGPFLGKPYTAPMGNGLFEVRARGKEGIGRILFCTVKGKEVVILHSFVKKTRKTPRREILIARRRLGELK